MTGDQPSASGDKEALSDFVMDKDLEGLERRLQEFNLFEAIGASRQELRHSQFLSFLLDPSESHGWSDRFLKKFLQCAVTVSPNPPFSSIDIDVWDLRRSRVTREEGRVDIKIADYEDRFQVIVENKIGTSEHGDQLVRYLESAKRECSHVLAIFLTPEGDAPSHQEYVPISYNQISDLVSEFLDEGRVTIPDEVRIVLEHYRANLRRNVVTDSEVAELIGRIYKRHRKAVDLIIAHLPDKQKALAVELEKWLGAQPGTVLDQSTKSLIRFASNQWDIPELHVAQKWTSTKRILLWEVMNSPDRFAVKLTLGPGPTPLRQRVLEVAKTIPLLASELSTRRARSATWTTLWMRTLIDEEHIQELEADDLFHELQNKMDDFLRGEGKEINTSLAARIADLQDGAS
ncbi:MAG: PDDEXK-like family protein [Acidimicrobiales bacterium]